MILRELFVKLGLDIDAQSFAKGQITASALEAAFHRLVETVSENIKSAIEYGDKIEKASQKIGVARKALQELQYAGSLADLSAEEMSTSIGMLSKKMEAAKTGSAEASKAFKGIEFLKAGKLKATDEVLGQIADKFESMPDGAEKTVLAMQLFGRSGKQMIPLLNKGRGELEAMRQEARDLGLVMDDDAVKASEELNDNLHRLHAISQGLWREAIGPLIPRIGELVKRFLAWRKENAAIIKQKIEKWAGYVAKGIDMISDAFTFLVDNGTAVKAIIGTIVISLALLRTAAIATAVQSAAAWIAAWAPVAAPFIALGAIVAGVLAIFDDLRVYSRGGKSVTGLWVKFLDDWTKPKADDGWLLKEVKSIIREAEKALSILRELDKLMYKPQSIDKAAGKSKKQVSAESDAMTFKTMRQRVGQGLPLTVQEKDVLKRSGVPEQSFVAQYAPPSPELRQMGSAMSGGSQINAPMTFNVTQQPGESSDGFANRVVEIAKGWWQGELQAATAGVKP